MRSNFSILLRILALSALGLWTGASFLWGQAPLVVDEVVTPGAGEAIVLDWKIDAAERALHSGLAGLAEDEYRAVLASPGLSGAKADGLRIRLASALIAQRRFVAARSVLEEISENRRGSIYNLYLGIAVYGDGKNVDYDTLNAAMPKVVPGELDAIDLPWFYLLQGLQAEVAGDTAAIVPAFKAAEAAAVTVGQQAFFGSLLFRQRILQTPSSEALASDMRTQLERFEGEAAAYPYAREYAVLLYNLGRIKEATDVIDAQRKNTQLGNREREQLLLLKGIMLGADSFSGREALQELIRSGKNREVLGVALQLLARSRESSSGSFAEFLNQLIARSEPHPLLGQIYYIRSQLALARSEQALQSGDEEAARAETAVAEADARFMLEQFPGLSQITNVYRLLAYAALQRSPAQYRAAADFLIQLRDQTENETERHTLNRLIGDCYFLNADYTNAVDFYEAARYRELDGSQDGELFLRLITAEVRSGQIESALQHIDEVDFSGSISISDRWRAEWNIAQALKSDGKLDQALKRVRLLLEGSTTGHVPTALDLRLRWMEAYLSFLARDDSGLGERVETLLGRIESIPEQALDPSEAKLLITEILLLKAKVLISEGDANGGTDVLRRIREGFANSSAAQRSYITEADYHASIGDFKAAQETLSKLASVYPDSLLAPQAIFEAAVYCERRGAEYFAEAVLLHNDIAVRYPQDPLVFSARLKQGDLLRRMNDFAGAQIVYENLINNFPTHPRRYVAELSRADCMLALAKNNDTQLGDVALTLERLIDIPNLPVDFQAEAGYKWGFVLSRRNEPEKAKEVFMLISSRILLDSEQAALLGASGRYWMSRSLLALGELLESEGEIAEAKRVYRKMVAFNLPGRNLAQVRADGLQVVEE